MEIDVGDFEWFVGMSLGWCEELLIGAPGLLLIGDKLVSSEENELLVSIEAVELKKLFEN